MPYVPNDVNVYVAAFAGALDAMSSSPKINTSAVSTDYDRIVDVAGTYAAAFDTIYPLPTAGLINVLSIDMIEGLSYASFQNRSPQDIDPLNTTANWTALSLALKAIIRSAGNYFIAQGIVPPPYPPGGGGCTTNNLTITGLFACAENDGNTASGDQSFAIGLNNVASGQASHVQGGGPTIGQANYASGEGSHCEGAGLSNATSLGSHAEGVECQSLEQGTHAEGEQSLAAGEGSHAEGLNSVAFGDGAHSEGQATYASGDRAHSEGTETIAGYFPSTFTIAAGGITVTIPGDVTDRFVNGDVVRIVPTATVTPPFFIPAATNIINSVPAFGGVNTTFDLIAPIDLTTVAGSMVDTSFGQSAHAQGAGSIARGTASHAEGSQTIATAHASHAMGFRGQTIRPNQLAHGVNTGFQFSRTVLVNDAVGGGATEDLVDIDGGSSFILEVSKCYGLRATFVASDGPGGSPTNFAKIVKECIVTTDGAPTPTLAFDTTVLYQDSGSGITGIVTVVGDHLVFSLNNPGGTTVGAVCTIEWSECFGPPA